MGFQIGNPAVCHPHVLFGVVVVHAVAILVANERIRVRQQDARHRHVEAMGLRPLHNPPEAQQTMFQ